MAHPPAATPSSPVQASDVPPSPVFSNAFELVPAFLFCAVLVFVGTAFDAALEAIVALAVFFLGIVPQIKMKRGDLLVELQERFNALAADNYALAFGRAGTGIAIPAPKTPGATVVSSLGKDRNQGYAFFLRFWYLQLLQFGLWRYGLLPSDTYSHWLVRRLLSFRSEERYWGYRPLQGWTLVKGEFLGTDFLRLMEAAMESGREVERKHGGKHLAQTPDFYNELHRRTDRLLVAVGGKGLWSTFMVRIFGTRRRSLVHTDVAEWCTLAAKPLPRERWSRHFAAAAATAMLLAFPLGFAVRGWLAARSLGGVPVAFADAGGVSTVLMASDEPFLRHVVGFDQEGACVPGSDARAWRGAVPSSASRARIAAIAKGLAACSTQESPVRLEVAGFASSSEFKTLAGCGEAIRTSADANLAIAHARAANVRTALEKNLPNSEIGLRAWSSVDEMQTARAVTDRLGSGEYLTLRGSLNRRVEIRVLDAGACDPNG